MSHIDDLREPGDDRDLDAPEEHEEPLDLDEISATYAACWAESCILGANGMKALNAVPALLAELRQAREQLAYWRGLPLREEYAVTDGAAPTEDGRRYPREAAESAVEVLGSTAWVRSVTVHPWQGLTTEPPF